MVNTHLERRLDPHIYPSYPPLLGQQSDDEDAEALVFFPYLYGTRAPHQAQQQQQQKQQSSSSRVQEDK
jgi:hypothetical protein